MSELRPPHSSATAPAREANREPLSRVVLDPAGLSRAVRRMAHEIVERNPDLAQIALVAIIAGGVPVARMLAEALSEITGTRFPFGELDVTLYRDDVVGRALRPIPRRTRMPFSALRKRVVLVDDVVFTGRTIRAAMDAVIDFGRPEAIQVACLIDRGHRELPIQVDFVGKNIPTSRAEQVEVRPREGGEYEVRVR
jgi:pyrimidine operon attenuation protein / uracil phosphoribosyltransferase